MESFCESLLKILTLPHNDTSITDFVYIVYEKVADILDWSEVSVNLCGAIILSLLAKTGVKMRRSLK